jgi:signal transduction histidine kinase
MRTPLTLVKGHAELLLRRLASGDGDTASTAAAAAIVKHTDHLTELLTTLFDLHCLESGLLLLAPWPMDLAALTREVTNDVRLTARHVIKIDAETGVVGEWDERRVRQVVLNLLSNALKYSPEGSTVTVSVSGDERSATVSVQDEGIGLDASELANVFRRGYRAEQAQRVKGDGLGLYFSQGLITKHGGRMWAESPGHGQGSTFWFSLPVSPVESSADRPVEQNA